MNKNESKYFNTAKKMDDALLSLLDKKDYLYITVKDICAEAGVNRSTFYLHYEGMDDLLQEVIENTSKSFAKHFNTDETSDTLQEKKNLKDLYLIKDEFIVPYLEFVKENKKVYKAANHYRSVFKVDAAYQQLFKTVFSPIMMRFGLEEKWHKYVTDFYITGLNSIIMDWAEDDCKEDVQDICDIIKNLIVKYEDK